MNMNFSGKNVIVSGGATGIGYAITKTYYKLGANVAICGRTESKLIDAHKTIVEDNNIFENKFIYVVCDMSIEDEVELLIDSVLKNFGSVDVFVNNSGVWTNQSILKMNTQDIDYAFNNILKPTILGTKYSGFAMIKSGKGGSIINIGSFAGIMPQKNASLYACLKASIISFTKSAASEFSEYGIRVNCLTPGVVSTGLTENYIQQNYENLIKPLSLKRIGTSEEVANGVIFLSSNHASYITGENLCITGGKYLTQS